MIRPGALLLFTVLASAAPLAAQSVPPDSAAKRLARGKELFHGKGLCMTCHGKDGVGVKGVGPRLADGEFFHTKGTLAEVVALITTGVDSSHSKSGLVMPPKGGSRLTAAEVEMVAEYVLSFRKEGQE